MSQYSYVFNAHPRFIESLYVKYRDNPESVEEGWRVFFEGFEFASFSNGKVGTDHSLEKEFGVYSIIYGFRARGHLLSTTNPIRQRRDRKPRLNLSDYGLQESDLDKKFAAAAALGLKGATLQEVIDRINFLYCGNIGFEYTHIKDREVRHWLRDQIENRQSGLDYGLDLDTKKYILQNLNGAEVFERFLHTKYIGQKRFSLEGGEATIPALQTIIDEGSEGGVEEFVIGMAHRGRLNVLANIMGKTYEQIFNEFEGTAVPDLSFGDGDVKYHLGYSSLVESRYGKKVHLKLVPNPSHLESVNPVVIGFSRAKADILYNSDFKKICPILIHGDAAIAGQGVAYELAQMSQLSGYYTGGAIHFVINNQIGFTTDFDDARTSIYSTGVGNLIQAPIFHVNGDDPEALIYCVKLAVEYRQRFHTDVFIDMVCYRKHGHNEGDDPKFTQPEMYGIVKTHPNPRKLYSDILVQRGDLESKIAKEMEEDFWSTLQDRLEMVKEKPLDYKYQEPEQAWRALNKKSTLKDFEKSPVTGIVKDRVIGLLRNLINVPEEFSPLGKVNRILKGIERLKKDNTLDWGMAELLAYASILTDGKDVRMSGQDVKRGTFSHRHTFFYDKNTYEEYGRLDNLDENQGKFRIYNSLLSEFAVLGFEYGYGLATPDSLVIWEAQFGDFFNGAQVIVDQYIAAAESKWQRMNGLVMLLPHGFEGQGPEHSSARLERFLQAAADQNMVIVNMTTPANLFHALRRQLAWSFRKPLVVMSPKSLLRHSECVSNISDFLSNKRFQEVIDDPAMDDKKLKKVKRLVLCTGKIYYDLKEYRDENNLDQVALVRLEQLYPFPQKQIDDILKKYSHAERYWVQEEPQNMGAWWYMSITMGCDQLKCISRKPSASPATGYKKIHEKQQKEIIEKTFDIRV